LLLKGSEYFQALYASCFLTRAQHTVDPQRNQILEAFAGVAAHVERAVKRHIQRTRKLGEFTG
jgi:hypothetical protein